MEREIVRLLPYILIGMFVLGVLLFLLTQHQLRLRRTGAYWRLRRRAGERGGRLFLLSIGLMALSVVLALLSGLGILAYRNVSPAPTRGPDDLFGIILSPSALDAATDEATSEATATLAPPSAEATPAATTTLALTTTPTLLVIPPTNTALATATATNTPTATATNTLTPMPSVTAQPSLTPNASSTPRPLRTPARF